MATPDPTQSLTTDLALELANDLYALFDDPALFQEIIDLSSPEILNTALTMADDCQKTLLENAASKLDAKSLCKLLEKTSQFLILNYNTELLKILSARLGDYSDPIRLLHSNSDYLGNPKDNINNNAERFLSFLCNNLGFKNEIIDHEQWLGFLSTLISVVDTAKIKTKDNLFALVVSVNFNYAIALAEKGDDKNAVKYLHNSFDALREITDSTNITDLELTSYLGLINTFADINKYLDQKPTGIITAESQNKIRSMCETLASSSDKDEAAMPLYDSLRSFLNKNACEPQKTTGFKLNPEAKSFHSTASQTRLTLFTKPRYKQIMSPPQHEPQLAPAAVLAI